MCVQKNSKAAGPAHEALLDKVHEHFRARLMLHKSFKQIARVGLDLFVRVSTHGKIRWRGSGIKRRITSKATASGQRRKQIGMGRETAQLLGFAGQTVG